jgi:hypothetical protein
VAKIDTEAEVVTTKTEAAVVAEVRTREEVEVKEVATIEMELMRMDSKLSRKIMKSHNTEEEEEAEEIEETEVIEEEEQTVKATTSSTIEEEEAEERNEVTMVSLKNGLNQLRRLLRRNLSKKLSETAEIYDLINLPL